MFYESLKIGDLYASLIFSWLSLMNEYLQMDNNNRCENIKEDILLENKTKVLRHFI